MIMKSLFSLLALIVSMNSVLLNSAFSEDLTVEQVRSIIMSGTDISSTEAEEIAKKVEETYGQSENGALRVSGVLKGSRWNYLNFFVDRNIWHFDASFIPEGQTELISVPKLIEAEFFNGGLQVNFISKDWVWIFLPSGMTIEKLDGFDTGRGFSVNSVVAIQGALYAAHELNNMRIEQEVKEQEWNHYYQNYAQVDAPLDSDVEWLGPAFEQYWHSFWNTNKDKHIEPNPHYNYFVPLVLSAGWINTQYGLFSIYTAGFGMKASGFTFPRLKMKVNPDIYHNI